MHPRVILLCTVGGSHQPIVTAIRESRPDHVCFICSGKDPGTGRAGSDVQVLGKGNIIKAKQEDPSPSLPNIPTQAGLAEGQYEVLRVPSDDLGAAFSLIHQKVLDLGRRFPDAALVADYTGGTKTMTAALVTAALETQEVDLQLVTGNRADLVKVRDGTQRTALASVEGIRLRRAMSPYLAAWARYAYDEAATGLGQIRRPREEGQRAALMRAIDLGAAFAAWDRFDHAEALRIMEIYQTVVMQHRDLKPHLLALKWCSGDKHEPLQLMDLWRNAERRAAQGRYDDAVARVYRLIEWTAQWVLKMRCGIQTSDVPPERIPPGVELTRGRNGKHQAGLFTAWDLIDRLTDGPAAQLHSCRAQRIARPCRGAQSVDPGARIHPYRTRRVAEAAHVGGASLPADAAGGSEGGRHKADAAAVAGSLPVDMSQPLVHVCLVSARSV